MKRWGILSFGVASYLMFVGVFLYAAGFVGGFLVPTCLDGPAAAPLAEALIVNSALLLAFGLQHSVMARQWFKRLLCRLIPEPLERSTYVLASNLALALLFWQWRPMGGTVWNVQDPAGRFALWGLFALGWLSVLATTCLINHFDLFGLRQTWLYFRGRECAALPFVTPGPYRFIRHPLYAGWMLAFWATPTMTAAHLLFAIGMTAYMLIAIRFEERDLVRFYRGYAAYRRQVPMLLPRLCSVRPSAQETSEPKTNCPVSALFGSIGTRQ